MADLTHEELLATHALSLQTPRRRYGLGAKVLFWTVNTVYGKKRTLSKFKIIELVARVPYQAWEQVAYIAITHTHESPALARRVFDRVSESRAQEDNEQWHLLILEEMITERGVKQGRIRFAVIPQLLAFVYYQISLACSTCCIRPGATGSMPTSRITPSTSTPTWSRSTPNGSRCPS